VKPVGELDQDDAHVARHGEQHLAEVLGLRVLGALELDAVELGDAVHELGDGLPKVSEISSLVTEVSSVTFVAAAPPSASGRRDASRRGSRRRPGVRMYGSPDWRVCPACAASRTVSLGEARDVLRLQVAEAIGVRQ